MKKLVAVLALSVASGTLASSVLAGGGAVSVHIARSGQVAHLGISGTKGSDQVRLERLSGDDYLIEANRPIEVAADRCTVVEADETAVECRMPQARYPAIGVHLIGGPDSLRVAGRDYAGLVVFAGPGNDKVIGGNDEDIVEGGDGDDAVKGRGGPDYVNGRAGDDTLGGGIGADKLVGGPGDDRCSGGPGRDTKRKC